MNDLDCFDSAAPRSARQAPASCNSNNFRKISNENREVPNGNRRLRRRGSRSQVAKLRRSFPHRCRTLPGVAPGESGARTSVSHIDFLPRVRSSASPDGVINHFSSVAPSSQDGGNFQVGGSSSSRSSFKADGVSKKAESINIYCINIRCVLEHKAELELNLDRLRPHIVLLQETWLNASVEQVSVHGYTEVSRRDRSPGVNRGGVLTLVRNDFNAVAHKCNSKDAERS